MLKIFLVKPAIEHAAAYQAMIQECIQCGEGYPYNNAELALEDFAAYARELEDEAQGVGLPPGIPAQQTFLLMAEDGQALGEFRLRPHFEPPYEKYNGHVAYNIRPTERRKGYATRGLALTLETARQAGIPGVMLTVEGENPGSVGAIRKNGGRLTHHTTHADGTVAACYWIDL